MNKIEQKLAICEKAQKTKLCKISHKLCSDKAMWMVKNLSVKNTKNFFFPKISKNLHDYQKTKQAKKFQYQNFKKKILTLWSPLGFHPNAILSFKR